jgi:hypothetical protein
MVLGHARIQPGTLETVFQMYRRQGSVTAGQVVRLSGAGRLLGASGRLGRVWLVVRGCHGSSDVRDKGMGQIDEQRKV